MTNVNFTLRNMADTANLRNNKRTDMLLVTKRNK